MKASEPETEKKKERKKLRETGRSDEKYLYVCMYESLRIKVDIESEFNAWNKSYMWNSNDRRCMEVGESSQLKEQPQPLKKNLIWRKKNTGRELWQLLWPDAKLFATGHFR